MARRVQDAVAGVRGTAVGEGVRIEVAADGRITDLRLADPLLAQAISRAHTRALAAAAGSVSDLRRELTEEPAIAHALRVLLESTPAAHDRDRVEDANPYALPVAVRRGYGVG